MRMQRGMIASARVDVIDPHVVTAGEMYESNKAKYEMQRKEDEEEWSPVRKNKMEPPQPPDHHDFTFRLAVTNTGEITIKDFLLVLCFETTLELLCNGSQVGPESSFRFEGVVPFQGAVPLLAKRAPQQRKLFPGRNHISGA